jgi:hypothetical protein
VIHDLITEKSRRKTIEMPASTAWPILLAFGVTLCFASLVTGAGVGIAGVVLVFCGVGGWHARFFPKNTMKWPW